MNSDENLLDRAPDAIMVVGPEQQRHPLRDHGRGAAVWRNEGGGRSSSSGCPGVMSARPPSRREAGMTTLKRILVVEDDESIRAVLDMALSDEGYEVIEAE